MRIAIVCALVVLSQFIVCGSVKSAPVCEKDCVTVTLPSMSGVANRTILVPHGSRVFIEIVTVVTYKENGIVHVFPIHGAANVHVRPDGTSELIKPGATTGLPLPNDYSMTGQSHIVITKIREGIPDYLSGVTPYEVVP